MDLFQLLQYMVELGASDLHLKVGRPPGYRIHGIMRFIESDSLTVTDLQEMLKQALDENQRSLYEIENEVDFALSLPGLGRFRGNIFQQRGTTGMVYRHIPTVIPTFDSLHLPPAIEDMAEASRGLVLVTGMTGSGKSTTLAAIVRHILETRPVCVMTVEDPVEFLHTDGSGMITQREVGSDTRSFNAALRHVLRQDPDVLVIGEIRDADTMRVALTAADTGHLVLSTLHTTDAIQTINRVVSLFPPNQHSEIRYLLAHNLEGICSLRLLRTKEGEGRIPAVELLKGCPTVQEYLTDEGKLGAIRDFMETGNAVYGTQTFDQCLLKLVQSDTIDLDEALRNATSPDEIKLRLSGVEGIDNLILGLETQLPDPLG